MDFDQSDTGYEASPHPEYSKQSLDGKRKEQPSFAGSKLFKCPECERTYTMEHHLERHMRSNHNRISYYCSECRKTFYGMDMWRSHLSLCVKPRQVEHHNSLPAVTALQDSCAFSDMHRIYSTPGLPAESGSYECKNLDTIDQFDLLASRTAESTKLLDLDGSSNIAASSEPRAHITNVGESPVGMDEWIRNSIRLEKPQRNTLQEALQEFLAFFGDKLIQATGSKEWMENTLLHGSGRMNKEMCSRLLENYAAEMMFLHCCFKRPQIAFEGESNLSRKDSLTFMDDTLELIHHYRANIADYFCFNSIEGLGTEASVVDSPLETTQKQSILRWYSSVEKSRSSQKGSRHIGNGIHKEIGTAGEGIIPNKFDLVKNTLVSNEVFHRLASELRLEVSPDFGSRKDTMSQIITSEFDLPRGVNTETLCISFEVGWDILNFMHFQYGELVPIATVVVLTGSSTNAQATTCGEYVRQNWPLFGSTFLSFIDENLASQSGDYVRVGSGSSPIKYVRDFALT
jgi:hypothetical protein